LLTYPDANDFSKKFVVADELLNKFLETAEKDIAKKMLLQM